MKTFLLLYIALLSSLGFVNQILLFNQLEHMLFVLLNVVCIPIITAYTLKLYLSIVIRPKIHR